MKKPEGIKFFLIFIILGLIITIWQLAILISQGSGSMQKLYTGILLIAQIIIGLSLIYGFWNARFWSWWLAILVLIVGIIRNIFGYFMIIPLLLLMCWYLFQKKEWFRSGGMTDLHLKADNVFIWLFIILIIAIGIANSLIGNYVDKALVEEIKNAFINNIS